MADGSQEWFERMGRFSGLGEEQEPIDERKKRELFTALQEKAHLLGAIETKYLGRFVNVIAHLRQELYSIENALVAIAATSEEEVQRFREEAERLGLQRMEGGWIEQVFLEDLDAAEGYLAEGIKRMGDYAHSITKTHSWENTGDGPLYR